MARNYDSVDFSFTWDGDFISEDGDLRTTDDDLMASLRTEVLNVIKSELQDWREDPGVGANISDFIGEANIPETARLMEARLKASLSVIVQPEDLFIRVVPVGPHKVMITLQIEVLATRANKLATGDLVSITLLFDYMERGVFATIEDLNKFGGREI